MAGRVHIISGRGVVRAYRSAQAHEFRPHDPLDRLRAWLRALSRRLKWG